MGINYLEKSNIGFIVQARMGSARLPNKVMFPLPLNNGKPMIQWIVDQLEMSKLPHQTIVATTKRKSDDILYKYCQRNSIECFRGDQDNVLSRYIAITEKKGLDHVVRLTGDNPLLDIDILDEVVNYHIKHNFDYSYSSGLPLGMNIEVISCNTLIDLRTKKLNHDDKEHVTPFLQRSFGLKKGRFYCNVDENLKKLRLTVDYPSDYALLSLVMSFYNQNSKMGIKLVTSVYKQFPWLFTINAENIQKSSLNKLKRNQPA